MTSVLLFTTNQALSIHFLFNFIFTKIVGIGTISIWWSRLPVARLLARSKGKLSSLCRKLTSTFLYNCLKKGIADINKKKSGPQRVNITWKQNKTKYTVGRIDDGTWCTGAPMA